MSTHGWDVPTKFCCMNPELWSVESLKARGGVIKTVVHRDSETLSHHWSSQSFPSLNLREKTVLLTFLTLSSQLGWGAREGLGFGLQGIWNSCYILKYLSRKKYATTLNIKCVSFFLLF